MFSTITRLGKIACLPNDIREQLNLRLHDGEQGPELLAWLNALPEARQQARLQGQEITPQNLSNWRQGGYQDWVIQRQVNLLAIQLARETQEMREEEELHGQRLGERLVQWLL
ncbi:MAG TPA: hypothetical protein VHH73_00835, partial [Verrucomicrobiae bacterium]|nr:hypothetical protein [Verrucomicrobiae bacterium]